MAILDADKEGFLRNFTSLIQTFGRAARNSNGSVIMYADHKTDSMIHAIAETTKRKGIVILISDLLDDKENIFKGLSHLKFLQHDVIILHTLDHQEINLDYDGLIEFEDLESNERIRTFPQSFKQKYSECVEEFLDDIKKTAGRSNVDYCLVDTSEPLDRAMIAFLSKRKRAR